MRIHKYSHKSGLEIIEKGVVQKIENVLHDIRGPVRKGCATKLRECILESLKQHGWSDTVRISAKRGLTLTAKHKKTALCLQTGNMARFYADLLKLQAQYSEKKITCAVYIIPTKRAARKMGDNLANYDRLTSELKSMFSKVITVPLLVLGFEEETNGGKDK